MGSVRALALQDVSKNWLAILRTERFTDTCGRRVIERQIDSGLYGTAGLLHCLKGMLVLIHVLLSTGWPRSHKGYRTN